MTTSPQAGQSTGLVVSLPHLPRAHVLLRNYRKQEPGADIIRLCSSLAAWYSSAKFSVNVPVDYTQVRYVRKPRGSAAGFVTYTNYKTCFANPLDIAP
jgi:predicted ribosome quality control (RQC) complex YloA/Tae2 family protein